MSFRTPAALTSRAITVRLPSSLLSLGIPLAAVRWNSSTASEWSNRRPNYLLLKPRIWSMLKNSPGNLSYTEKLEKLREDFADNSDLQGDDISLTNIPHFVEAERVREYISKFGTVVECFPESRGHFRVKFSSHQEAKKAVETINSATEYPIDVGFEYNIRLPLVADYSPPTALRKAGIPSRKIMVCKFAGGAQAIVDIFAKHATVVSSYRGTSHRHGVARPNLFVGFNSVQDAEKVFSALDGKVTVSDHQYDFVYAREWGSPQKPNVAPTAEGASRSVQ